MWYKMRDREDYFNDEFFLRKTSENRYSIDMYRDWFLYEKWIYKWLKIEKNEEEIKQALKDIHFEKWKEELNKISVLRLLLEKLWIDNYDVWSVFNDWLNDDLDINENEDNENIEK